MIRTVLRTEHVTMQFGGVIAVNDLNIVVKEHDVHAYQRARHLFPGRRKRN